MSGQPAFSKLSFIKTFCIAMPLIFLIPATSLWFFRYAERHTDADVLEAVLRSVDAEKDVPAERKEEARRYFRAHPASQIMVGSDSDTASIRHSLSGMARTYFIFRWMIRIAFFCLVSSVVVGLLLGLGVLMSFRSQAAQYWSLSIGWHVLKFFAAFQVIGQGILATALSYWVTAIFANSYYPKIIFMVGILAFLGCLLLIKAIFTKLDLTNPIEGRVLEEGASPSLWGRVGELCARLQIAPPNQIVVGIDDSFFVTEHPILVADKRHEGRTLFASLSLLKVLNKSEADAILAHEMAHFSGQDTVYSRRISPLMARYGNYLEALHGGALSRPVFYFMLFFWSLYQLSLNRLRRQREFRADRIAAEQTSPRDFANGLLKICAYSLYRRKIEQSLFEEERVLETADISVRIRDGFTHFLGGEIKAEDLSQSEVAHPFDSHPLVTQRLEALGQDAPTVLAATRVAEESDSWFAEIDGAERLEREQWTEYENKFRAAHEESLAFRYLPATDEERAHVLKFFPPVSLSGKKEQSLAIDFEKMHYTKWTSPIRFEHVRKMSLESNVLTVEHWDPAVEKARKDRVKIDSLSDPVQKTLEVINRYYGRHQVARQIHEKKARNGDAMKEKLPTEPVQ